MEKEDVTYLGIQPLINGERKLLVNLVRNGSTVFYNPEKHNLIKGETNGQTQIQEQTNRG